MTESESFRRGISPQSAWPWRTSEDSMNPILTDEDIDRVVVNNGYDGVEPQFDYDFRKFARSLESLILSRLGGGEAVAVYKGHRLTPEGTKEFWGYADKPLPAGTKLYTSPQPATGGEAVAPWPDFLGQPIHHGARLVHPVDGNTFVAVRLEGYPTESEAWRAVYDNDPLFMTRLCLQIGDKGRAVLATPAAPSAMPGDSEMLDWMESNKISPYAHWQSHAIGRGFCDFLGWSMNGSEPTHQSMRDAIAAAMGGEGKA